MQKWEYIARTFNAEKDNDTVKEHLRLNYPQMKWSDLPKNHPITLEAQLCKMGNNGWELVSVEPIDYSGSNGDLAITYTVIPNWRRAYFCVFKRLKADTE